MSVNKVILLGRLGKDPELKYTANGSPVANVSIATSESWKDKNGQKQERTEWHRVVAYGKTAELLSKYCSKGTELYLEGRLQTRSWEKDGSKQYVTEIILTEMRFVSGNKRKDGVGNDQSSGDAPDMSSDQEINDASFAADDIPF